MIKRQRFSLHAERRHESKKADRLLITLKTLSNEQWDRLSTILFERANFGLNGEEKAKINVNYSWFSFRSS